MQKFRKRLQQALSHGVALASLGTAGCLMPVESGCGFDSGAPLSPYALDAATCSGPGAYRQCCVTARCYTPDAGEACVAVADAHKKVSYPPGSGWCLCNTPTGPFAPNPQAAPADNGTCCYLVGSQGCDGRPLLVEGVALIASLTHRSDWAAGA